MSQSDVSVIVPVYNAMPYLVSCLSSVMEQSIGCDRIEVVAVDDGSTDGSAEQLDLLARYWDRLRVFHERPSGGPSRPRNLGLEHATGRYVFFLDADDYLAPEALQRTVALAEERGSDMVVCRRKGVGGRHAPSPLDPLTARPRHGRPSADAYDSALRRSQEVGRLTAFMMALDDCGHLFRRERIERLGLRFTEDIHLYEDTVFSAGYINSSSTVSMVDDYVCYYTRLRDDGNNITTRLAGTEMHLRALGVAAGVQRDHPELRGLRDKVVGTALMELTDQIFSERFLRHEPDVRKRMMDGAREFLDAWLTPRVQRRMPALGRVKIDLLYRGKGTELLELIRAELTGQWGKEIVRAGRVYGAHPYFGDTRVGVPDECYDVTADLPVRHHLTAMSLDGTRLRVVGHAYIERVDTVDTTTAFVLRERLGRTERRWTTRPLPTPELSLERGLGRYDYDLAGFGVEIDLADVSDGPLPAGQWGAFLSVRTQGITKEVPLGDNRAETVESPIRTRLPAPTGSPRGGTVSVHFTKYGRLTLDVNT